MYVALAFVSIYFNAAVIGTAMKRLQGEDASIHDGLALARQHIGKIFVWAVITATVGMILRSLQERAGILGRIVLGIVGIAWTVLTFFVVPVLLYEPVGVGDAIKRSGSIFRQRWGETFVGNGTIGIAIFLVSIPVVIVGGLLAAVVPVLGIVLLVVAIGVAHGDRLGDHRRVQRRAVPVRDDRRDLRRLHARRTWRRRSGRSAGAGQASRRCRSDPDAIRLHPGGRRLAPASVVRRGRLARVPRDRGPTRVARPSKR